MDPTNRPDPQPEGEEDHEGGTSVDMAETTIGAVDFAGTYGQEHRYEEARIDLCYDPAQGWSLQGSTRGQGDGIPMDVRLRRSLRYELARKDLLVLRDEDAPNILYRLGGDLTDLLDRIASGHSIEREGNNLVGRLDDAADTAHLELLARIDRCSDLLAEVPETWSAGMWIGDDGILEPDDTAESLLAEAELSGGIRIWGGVDAMRRALEAHR